MRTLFCSALAILALTGPTFADPADDARDHFAQSAEGGDGVRYTGKTSAGNTAWAMAHFAAANSGDGARRRDSYPEASDLIISTAGAGSVAAARAKLDTGLKGDN